MPTSTDPQFGPDQFAAGITGVVLKQNGPWTVGALANHLWNLGGSTDISDTFFQPFVTYTTPTAWTFSLNTETNHNWISDEASVPINAVASKLVRIGRQPVSIGAGVRYWADTPAGGPEGWGLRLTVTLLYPK
ncbi:hypothetical protein [Ruegeria marina]|uniref:Transporter n=1 Tax=Ruegeria marina TaxID=639004 RepID=A0A1G6WBI8_9RHOB|nr:hypothetical protein [Ruegeria marina]SDD63043.1 hypothetical protein SAMN04488239_10930 [Ruegeria marina]